MDDTNLHSLNVLPKSPCVVEDLSQALSLALVAMPSEDGTDLGMFGVTSRGAVLGRKEAVTDICVDDDDVRGSSTPAV